MPRHDEVPIRHNVCRCKFLASRTVFGRTQKDGADTFSHRKREQEFETEAMVHSAGLLRVATRLTSSVSLAEDLTQETLLRAWRSFDQFERGTNCKAWLFRIMMNVWNRQWHDKVARMTVELEAEPAERLVAESTSSHSVDVMRALEFLGEEQRAVILLVIVEGFTCREVAGILGIPIGTVMSRLSRARAELRALLDSDKSASMKNSPKAIARKEGIQ